MPTAAIFAKRSDNDIAKIVRAGLISSRRVSGTIRARIMEQYRAGTAFNLNPYVRQQLLPLLTDTMLAGHLAGFRRLWLIRRQEPSLMRRMGLKLSALDDAVAFLQKRANLDINALQEKYKTTALRALNDVSDEVERQLSETVRELIATGAPAREAIRVLGERFDELGLTPANSFQLETIFRTQLQISYGAGKYQAEQDGDIQEILWGYKYVTVGDDRVRESHAVLDGVTLPKDDAFWQRFYPPNGYNCRCQAIPIFETRDPKEPKLLSDGSAASPDKGFDFNPGNLLR